MLTFVLDCSDPQALAKFWGAALGYQPVMETGPYVVLGPDAAAGDGQGPIIVLQGVPEPKQGKNRMHLDIHVDDIEGEVARLEALGAVRADPDACRDELFCWQVMTDPEGNEFCVCQPTTPGAAAPS
ncbi:MAG: VOC family protein [Actinobacteria bacterium]|nr:VOC family protein [Actinomycetota bacterium]